MEAIVWIIVIVFGSGGIMAFMKSAWFQHKLLVKKPELAVPAKGGVVPTKTLKQVNDDDHKFWEDEYRAIIQKDCDHLYHNQSWYTCRLCGQEEPWEHVEGCQCVVAEDRSITDNHSTYHLIRRSPSCTIHGKDYKLMPISDRKVGPFGGRSNSSGDYYDETPYTLSKALTKGRVMTRIDLPTREGTN